MGVMNTLSKQLEKVIEIFNYYRIAQGKTPYLVIFEVIDMNTTIGEVLSKREPITTDECIEFSKGLRKMKGLKI